MTRPTITRPSLPRRWLFNSRTLGVGAVVAMIGLGALGTPLMAQSLVRPTEQATAPSTHSVAGCGSIARRVDQFTPRVDPGLTTLEWRRSTVPLTASGLAGVRLQTAQESLWFHSLAWLIPVAKANPAAAARIATTYAVALPDPGAAAQHDEARRTGWSEGQIRRRLETMECLTRLTGRAEFAQVARTLGSALMDDRRYYGLPLRPPHNHGAQANRLLLRTGVLFDRPEWIQTSRERIRRDRASVFSACGMSDEQSTGYQWLNVNLWEDLARAAGLPSDPRARLAAQALVRPDGVAEPIGDGRVRTGLSGGGSLWCPQDGWAAATQDGMHYTVRFGPATTRHGHDDRGAITWFTHGRAVLEERATASKSDLDAIAWTRSRAAHTALEGLDTARLGTLAGQRMGHHAFAVAGHAGDERVRRSATFDVEAVRVTDAVSSSQPRTWIQHWHFAATWKPERSVGRGVIELVSADGARVQLTCGESGRPIDPVAVRVPTYVNGARAWAWDLQCRHRGTDASFTSVVRWIGEARTAESDR